MSKGFPWELLINKADTLSADDTNDSVINNAASGSAPAISLLQNYCLIEVTGPDAEKFLQGQLTCDVTKVTNHYSSFGACCNNKGRMLGLFKIARFKEDHFLLRLPALVANLLVVHLNKYVVFFKCSCIINPAWACIAYTGKPDILQKVFPVLPEQPGKQKVNNGSVVIKSFGREHHFELWLHLNSAQQISKQLAPFCSINLESKWNLAEIKAGIGEIYHPTIAEFIPQMFNLQVMNGISFNKGCYTGQEIIARMQYLGKLKKRLYLLATDNLLARINDTVYLEKTRLGKIVRAETGQTNQSLALAVLDNRNDLEHKVLQVGENEGSSAKVITLPYPLPENSAIP